MGDIPDGTDLEKNEGCIAYTGPGPLRSEYGGVNEKPFSSQDPFMPTSKPISTGEIVQTYFTNLPGHPHHQHINHFQIYKIGKPDIPIDCVHFYPLPTPPNPDDPKLKEIAKSIQNYYRVGDWHDTLQYPSKDAIDRTIPNTMCDCPKDVDYCKAPTGSRVGVTARWPADEFNGEMFFHCHILQHEDVGMMAIYDIKTGKNVVWPGARLIEPNCALPGQYLMNTKPQRLRRLA